MSFFGYDTLIARFYLGIFSYMCLLFPFYLFLLILKHQVDDNSDIFKSWYPPLEKTVSCLSKLYHCLEPAVFTGLAQVCDVVDGFFC